MTPAQTDAAIAVYVRLQTARMALTEAKAHADALPLPAVRAAIFRAALRCDHAMDLLAGLADMRVRARAGQLTNPR